MQEIDIEPQAADFDGDWRRRRGALQNSGAQFESFGFSRGCIVPLNERFPSKKVDNRRDDQRFAQIHRHGEGLEHEIVAVAVENYPGKPVALAPDDSTQRRIDLSPVAIVRRLRDPAFEKIKVEVLTLPRKSAGHDLGFGIVNRAPDQFVAAVLKRNNVAIGRSPENLQHFAGEDPVVSM